MKSLFLFIAVVAVAGYFYYSRTDSPIRVEIQKKNEQALEQEMQSLSNGLFVLNTEESTMAWQGSRPLIKGYFDNGLISLKGGVAIVASGSLVEGAVIVDMTSIRTESTGRGQGEDRLTTDLKSARWFDVENFPESFFAVSAVGVNEDGTVTLSGELTIQDKTNSISFVATVRQDGERVIVSAEEIKIDRTRWDIRYGSGTFFDNLGEQLIDDIFKLTFSAVFEPAVE